MTINYYDVTESPTDEPIWQARGECDGCGREVQNRSVLAVDVQRHVEGEHVQDVWPDLNDKEREVLIAARAFLTRNPFATYLCTPCMRSAN
jgi:hypothetical protein